MSFDFAIHWEVLLILPLLAMHDIECEHCEENHGWSLIVGWLYWDVALVFEREHDKKS